MIEFPISIAKDNQNYWEEFIQLRESKFGKDKKYMNKLSECRMIADNFLKIKKEEDNFNKRVWAVSNCMKDYETIMELTLHPFIQNILNSASNELFQCLLLFVFSLMPVTECRLTIPFGILVFG